MAALVRTRPQSAEATIEHLADVLRRTLDRSRRTRATVRDEVEYLRAYLAIEQERFGERLRVDWDIEHAAEPLVLPPLTLQPLVENALKHGIGGRLEGGSLRMAAHRRNGRLLLEVGDDGVGFPPRPVERTGLGNLRERLAALYGQDASLDVETSRQGSRVRVVLPADQGGDEGGRP